jgi:hypothetical protein
MIDIRPTTYTVTGLPEDDVNSTIWALRIEWRGPGDCWAVLRHSYALSHTGWWDWEPSPSNRTDEFKTTHRFTLTEAMERARAEYPKLVINGLCVRNGELVEAPQ